MSRATNAPRVLVVEDDEALASSICEALEDEGFATSRARDGHEALSRLRAAARAGVSQLPAVILLDLMMPVLDGFGFRKRQLEDPELASIPVIVSSCVGERAIEKMSGVAAFLKKPYDLDQLLRTLRAACELRG